VGTFGDAACFSFYPSKNLGALGDGGAVVCNNKVVAQAIRAIQNCGQQQKNNIVRIGRNSRLDAFQAAVLHLKLKYLDSWNEARRQAAHQLNQALKGLGGITLPEEKPDAGHVYHLYVIQCANRPAVETQLQAANIDWGCHYPFLLHQVFNHKPSCPIAEGYIDNILSLPMFPGLTDDEIERIVNALKA
jgi:dTDP-4-amino-4,6-dideoxygalactose transaminase